MATGSHQRESPPVPASGETRNGDHRRQARRQPPAGDMGQHHQVSRTEGVKKPMQYTIVIERSPRNYAAYAPDLPGCIATGATREEAVREMRRAIAFDIESLREHGEPVPEPRCTAAVVDVAAAA